MLLTTWTIAAAHPYIVLAFQYVQVLHFHSFPSYYSYFFLSLLLLLSFATSASNSSYVKRSSDLRYWLCTSTLLLIR